MRAVSRELSTEAREIVRPDGLSTDQMVADVLKDIARALWPTNTAAHLASLLINRQGKPVDIRTVERYFEGNREWSSDAIAAIVSEILRRHQMRNVKVVARK